MNQILVSTQMKYINLFTNGILHRGSLQRYMQYKVILKFVEVLSSDTVICFRVHRLPYC